MSRELSINFPTFQTTRCHRYHQPSTTHPNHQQLHLKSLFMQVHTPSPPSCRKFNILVRVAMKSSLTPTRCGNISSNNIRFSFRHSIPRRSISISFSCHKQRQRRSNPSHNSTPSHIRTRSTSPASQTFRVFCAASFQKAKTN